MEKDIINLDAEDIYLPKKVSFQLNKKEYSILKPTVRKRVEYMKIGKSLKDETDPEKAISTLIQLCTVAISDIEEEVLLECTEEQLAKIVDLISEHYGMKAEKEPEKKASSGKVKKD